MLFNNKSNKIAMEEEIIEFTDYNGKRCRVIFPEDITKTKHQFFDGQNWVDSGLETGFYKEK